MKKLNYLLVITFSIILLVSSCKTHQKCSAYGDEVKKFQKETHKNKIRFH